MAIANVWTEKLLGFLLDSECVSLNNLLTLISYITLALFTYLMAKFYITLNQSHYSSLKHWLNMHPNVPSINYNQLMATINYRESWMDCMIKVIVSSDSRLCDLDLFLKSIHTLYYSTEL